MSKEYPKLVRDKIPQMILESGREPIMHFATEAEYREALKNKLYEEVEEFLSQPSCEEVADILEVIRAICHLNNIDISKLESIREQKAAARGGFQRRIILDQIKSIQ